MGYCIQWMCVWLARCSVYVKTAVLGLGYRVLVGQWRIRGERERKEGIMPLPQWPLRFPPCLHSRPVSPAWPASPEILLLPGERGEMVN